jgi:hypothetical protein
MTNTVTIGVASREEVNARFMRAMTTGERAMPFIGFVDRLEARQPHPIEAADHHVFVLAAQHAGQQAG